MTQGRKDQAGTIDQKPRWEGPPENRPRGYMPAKDDPSIDRDAAGENLRDPDRSTVGDGLKTRKQIEKDAKGQFARSKADASNDGVISAEPRVISRDPEGDATFPLKRKQGK